MRKCVALRETSCMMVHMTETTDRDGNASTLLRPREVADMLHVHPRTLQRMADRGDITAVVLPSGHRRYRHDEIHRIINGRKAVA